MTGNLPQSIFFRSTNLKKSDLHNVLGKIMSRTSIDYADMYFQNSHYESWFLEDGIVKQGNYGIDHGVGIRAVSGEKTGFAYSDDISLSALIQASKTASAISSGGKSQSIQVFSKNKSPQNFYDAINPLDNFSSEQKVKLLESIDKATRQMDDRITQVMVSLAGCRDVMLVACTDGTLATDVRPLVRFSVSVIIESNGQREQASAGGGARLGYDFFLENDRALSYAKDAVRQAITKLDAIEAPAGSMPVVLGAGWPGVLLHEAIGHGLEGDFNRKGSSAFSGRIGERVASSICTIVDDGTLRNRRGSLNIDDEGTPTQCTTLIENGILKGYLQDKLNAKLMGVAATGNGRRESYAHLPMPRMTNTYMLAGKADPLEIIASVKKGLYAVNFGGGQVDITSGKFVFSASEAYLIEDGKVTMPVRGATLIGNGPDVLTKVSMIGNDLAFDAGVGTCGKEGQSVPVGVGQPTLKVDELTVGGTNLANT